MWSSFRRPALPGGFLALFLLGCLIWQASVSLTRMGFELLSVRGGTVQRAWEAPLERRIEYSFRASGTPYEAYRIVRDNAEEDARVFFLARRSEHSFRAYNRLSALLYPRILVYVCDSEEEWRPEPDERYSASYVLTFDSVRDVRPAGARPMNTGDAFLLWKLEG